MSDARMELWLSTIAAIRNEWTALDAAERAWISTAVAEIATLQQQVQNLVDAADGATICRDCAGDCCGHGAFHPTLVTVLAHLASDRDLPAADFTRSCPWLGAQGCQFLADVRPFNCVTFVCEQIDAKLPAELYADLESRLRELYTAFDRRYAGSSLRGLLNSANRRPGAYLARRAA